jgi:hypothetical protein
VPLSPPLFRMPLTDQDGLLARPWQQWFLALWERVGGATDSSLTTEEFGASVAFLGQVQQAVNDLTIGTVFRDGPVPVPRQDEALFAASPPRSSRNDESAFLEYPAWFLQVANVLARLAALEAALSDLQILVEMHPSLVAQWDVLDQRQQDHGIMTSFTR